MKKLIFLFMCCCISLLVSAQKDVKIIKKNPPEELLLANPKYAHTNIAANTELQKTLSSNRERLSVLEYNRYVDMVAYYDRKSNQILFSQGKGLSGKSKCLSTGKYNLATLGFDWNDKLFSLILPENYTVILFEDDNFQGESMTVQGFGLPSIHSDKAQWMGYMYSYSLPTPWLKRISSFEIMETK